MVVIMTENQRCIYTWLYSSSSYSTSSHCSVLHHSQLLTHEHASLESYLYLHRRTPLSHLHCLVRVQHRHLLVAVVPFLLRPSSRGLSDSPPTVVHDVYDMYMRCMCICIRIRCICYKRMNLCMHKAQEYTHYLSTHVNNTNILVYIYTHTQHTI